MLFNVIFFSTNVDPRLDELITMEPEVRADALEYVARQKAGGATNVFESLMAALADQRVDTIYLLTDGMPSSGAVRDPRAIRDRISRIYVVRKVKIRCAPLGRGHRRLAQRPLSGRSPLRARGAPRAPRRWPRGTRGPGRRR